MTDPTFVPIGSDDSADTLSTVPAESSYAGPLTQIYQVRVVNAMTVPFTVQVVGEIPADADDAAREAEAARLAAIIDPIMPRIQEHLDHIEAAFSPFREDSEVCRARRGDWSALTDDPDFATIYALTKQAKQLTDGHFDPMHAGVYDPTGIVKGWSVQRAHERFLEPLTQSGAVAAVAIGGGGDIQASVNAGSEFVWHIGVQDPSDMSNTLMTLDLRDGAVATSGTYERGEHITRTDHDLAQASVVDAKLVYADMWATTAIAAGERTFRRLLDRGDYTAQGLAAVLVHRDGEIVTID